MQQKLDPASNDDERSRTSGHVDPVSCAVRTKKANEGRTVNTKEWKWTLLLAAVAAHAAEAQTSAQVARPALAGNPLDALPQVNAPQKPPAVTVDVQPKTRISRNCLRVI